jgi:nitrate reductase beta subunit
MSLGSLFKILSLKIKGVLAMNINLDKCTKLYEIKTSFHIDPSKSKPYRVRIETIFHDKEFLSHIKDAYSGYNFEHIYINLIDFYPFKVASVTNCYTEVADERLKFIDTLKVGGTDLGTANRKAATRFLEKIEHRIKKHFSKLEERYREARQAAAVNV